MSKAQLKRIEQKAIEQIKAKPVNEITRLVFNTAGIYQSQFDIVNKTIPHGVYCLPTYEFRVRFAMLEWICTVSGLLFWRNYSLFQKSALTETEFNGVCLGLNDVVKSYKLDVEKAKVMGLGAFYAEMADQSKAIEDHCPNKRKAVYDEIIQGAESMQK